MGTYLWILAIIGYSCAANGIKPTDFGNSVTNEAKNNEPNTDLNSAASTYYSSWSDPYGNNGYGITGQGVVDKNYNAYYGGYDKYQGYNYESIGHGYIGGYEGNSGDAGYSHYKNNVGYRPGIFAHSSVSGNGGYGGYGGNGGLGSYSGYNNPYYNGANHLGYGYYKKPAYSGIYNSGITPSLVTGYRGYSKK